MKINDKIYFKKEKKPYRIKAMNDRFLICTKPFNLKHTVLYTIVDLNEKIRGTNNLIFNCYDYAVLDDVNACLNDLEHGLVDISHRNRVPLDIVKREQ